MYKKFVVLFPAEFPVVGVECSGEYSDFFRSLYSPTRPGLLHSLRIAFFTHGEVMESVKKFLANGRIEERTYYAVPVAVDLTVMPKLKLYLDNCCFKQQAGRVAQPYDCVSESN